MKTGLLIGLMFVLTAMVFAEGSQELSQALTDFVGEGKEVVAEYAPQALDGLVLQKARYCFNESRR